MKIYINTYKHYRVETLENRYVIHEYEDACEDTENCKNKIGDREIVIFKGEDVEFILDSICRVGFKFNGDNEIYCGDDLAAII